MEISFPGTIDNKSGIVLSSPIVGNGIGVNILNPEIVIIGGGYYRVKNLIGESIRETARLRSRPINKETEIVFTDFGLDACVYGAATLAIKKFIDYG